MTIDETEHDDSEPKEVVEEPPSEPVFKKLNFEEMGILLQETNFNKVAIKNWHKAFYTECPEGISQVWQFSDLKRIPLLFDQWFHF